MSATPVRSRMNRPERRAQILESARTVFLELGAGARILDIANAAGVNAALLYQHFPSKDALYEAAVIEPLHRTAQRLVDNANDLPTDVSGVPQYNATRSFLSDLLISLRDSARLINIVLAGDRETATTFYRNRITPVMDVMASVVERNLSSWSHRDFDPAITTKATFGMCWGLAIDHAFSGETELDVDTLADQLTSMMFFGLAVPGDDQPPGDG